MEHIHSIILIKRDNKYLNYENLMNETNDPDLLGPLSFLRQREVVHYHRFKDLLEYYQNGH